MPLDAATPEPKFSNTANTIHRKCAACAGEEEETAETPVMRKEAFVSATPPPADTPPSIKNVISSGGQPLDRETRNFFEPRFGADLGHVRIHTGPTAAHSARAINAKAYTLGNSIVFANSEYNPDRQSGGHLLAHELAHVMQQTTHSDRSGKGLVATRVDTPVLARSVDQWLSGSLNIGGLSYTQLIDEIDELNQWLQRQTTSSPDTVRIEESLGLLRAEVTRRDRAAAGPSERAGRRGRRGATRTTPTASTEPLPARYPRVLTEMTSVAYENPAEMRAEYDLIMEWLARRELSATERRILTAERDNLAPQLNIDRERVATERHAARVRSALTPDPGAADALTNLARTIQSITAEPDNPALFYIYHQGERIAISREQAEGLRTNLRSELRLATTRIDSDAQSYWSRYNSQLALNRDSPLIAAITGWLANVEDPGEELSSRYFWIRMRVRRMLDHLEAGRMVEAAEMMPQLEQVGQEIRSLARTFYEGHIEGAEIAIHRLTITRDVSFAIAGSIAAVVAAPVVAGAVGAGGLGLTGASATIATVGGTGVVVGTGMAAVRGTSSAVGTLGAGGSWHEVGEAFTSEAITGFREGFLAGAGGAASRSLGLAIGVGGSLTRQAAMRVGGEMLINGTTAMVDSLWRSCRSPQGCNVAQAAQAAVMAAAQAAPAALIGGSNNPIVRNLVAPFTAAGTSYLVAREGGASSEDALILAGAALASNIAMTRATHGAEVDAALVERGRSIGASVRETTTSAGRTARSYVAATMIGMADALPPARAGFAPTPVDTVSVPATARRVGASPPPETTSPTTVPTETPPSPVAPRETAPVESAVAAPRESPSVPPPTTPPPDVAAPIPSRPRGRGATAEGFEDEFAYAYHPDAPDPVVETRRGSGGRRPSPETPAAPPRPTAETEPAAPRRSTSSDIEAELAETSGGTSRGGSSSDPDDLNVPNPHQAEEIAPGSRRSEFSAREVWEPPPGARPAPPVTAPVRTRLRWLRQRFRIHVEQAMERYRVEGLTPAQEAAVADNPGLERAYRGSRIDQFAKDSIMQDPELAAVITAPDYIPEPDILDSLIPHWFDMTTTRQWLAHQQTYGARYGRRRGVFLGVD
jgi:hypothetical protein